jgi:hypothetical protein
MLSQGLMATRNSGIWMMECESGNGSGKEMLCCLLDYVSNTRVRSSVPLRSQSVQLAVDIQSFSLKFRQHICVVGTQC